MRTQSWENIKLGATQQEKMAERHQLLSPVSSHPVFPDLRVTPSSAHLLPCPAWREGRALGGCRSVTPREHRPESSMPSCFPSWSERYLERAQAGSLLVTMEGNSALALLREFPVGLSLRFSSQPLPHTALTPASTPSRSDVAVWGGEGVM